MMMILSLNATVLWLQWYFDVPNREEIGWNQKAIRRATSDSGQVNDSWKSIRRTKKWVFNHEHKALDEFDKLNINFKKL